MEDIIRSGLDELKIPAAPEQAALLARYGALVLERNKVMNLTGAREGEVFAREHILDCAALLRAAQFENRSVIDVGAGAGLPGLVIRILEPSAALTLLDATGKKADFLRETAAALGLSGVRCVHARAEEQALLPEFREAFDFAVSRGVARLDMLAELTLPFVRTGGFALCMKAERYGEELREAETAIELLGGAPRTDFAYVLPALGIRRRVCMIEKTGATPAGYPRRWARIQADPLKGPEGQRVRSHPLPASQKVPLSGGGAAEDRERRHPPRT